MKVPVDSPLIPLILGNTELPFAELFTVTLVDGAADYFTSLDIPIIYGGHTFKANALRFEGLKFKIAVGWQIDEQELKIDAFPGETLCGASFFTAVAAGLLDGATITRQRAFYQPTGIPWNDFNASPVAVVTLSTMRVSTITKIGRTHAEMKLKSPLVLLDIEMPRNTYQPGCQWSLFDEGCTLDRATFASSYVVVSATLTSVTVASVYTVTGADTYPYYQFGRIKFTSGVNDNLLVSVQSNDTDTFYFRFPIDVEPVPGDSFVASPGCSKSEDTCTLKFSNLANFRGFPRVPPVKYSV